MLFDFFLRYLELSVAGKGCPPLLTAKEKEAIHKREEKISLDMLRNNGLIQKPLIIKQNYAHFEIVEQQNVVSQYNESLFSRNHSVRTTKSSSDNGNLSPDNCSKKIPPTRLLKLDKTKPIITTDQIEEKILKANQRKKVYKKGFKLSIFRQNKIINYFVK